SVPFIVEVEAAPLRVDVRLRRPGGQGRIEEARLMERRRRILIADIDDELLTKLTNFFEEKGYETTTAWGGREALRELSDGGFDVVLLSDYLPGVESAELWRAVRGLPGRPAVALMQAVRPGPEIPRTYFEEGGICVLRKRSATEIAESLHACLSTGNEFALGA
ncbi:MAG TPA: hypothetical protein VFM21_04070, partial [Terriglobia bacterium]|nr:hypothetical protein [Terriglobia bacterium]